MEQISKLDQWHGKAKAECERTLSYLLPSKQFLALLDLFVAGRDSIHWIIELRIQTCECQKFHTLKEKDKIEKKVLEGEIVNLEKNWVLSTFLFTKINKVLDAPNWNFRKMGLWRIRSRTGGSFSQFWAPKVSTIFRPYFQFWFRFQILMSQIVTHSTYFIVFREINIGFPQEKRCLCSLSSKPLCSLTFPPFPSSDDWESFWPLGLLPFTKSPRFYSLFWFFRFETNDLITQVRDSKVVVKSRSPIYSHLTSVLLGIPATQFNLPATDIPGDLIIFIWLPPTSGWDGIGKEPLT